MAYPVLAPQNTWYKGETVKSTLTEINIVDSYTVTGSETESWYADVGNSGSIVCYVNGTVLTIVGNGSGKIACNADSKALFSDVEDTDVFSAVTAINGGNILDTSAVTIFYKAFNYCEALETLDVSNWDVSNVTHMGFMFNHCVSLDGLDVSKWDVSSVTNMKCLFQQKDYGAASSFTALDVTNWDVSKVTDMGWMFYGCYLLTSLDLSGWDVSNVTSFDHMFSHDRALIVSGTENWDVSKATTMRAMFHSLKNTSYDVSGWDVSNCEVLNQLFEGNLALTEIVGLETWDTSKCISFCEMFINCSALTELDLSSFDTRSATSEVEGNIFDMFTGMSSLEKIALGKNFGFSGDGTLATPAVLPTPASGFWYAFPEASYAPADVPSFKAATYYANAEDVPDGPMLVKNSVLKNIASAIREKLSATDKYTPGEMPEAISQISGGGDDDGGEVVAKIGNVEYTSVKKALEAAQSGETVTMVADSDETDSDLVIPAGVTLNVGVFNLTARSLVGGNGSYLVGDAYHATSAYGTVEAETLKLDETAIIVSGYPTIPLWNPAVGAYVFSKFLINTTASGTGLQINEEEHWIHFQFAQQMTGAARTGLLMDNGGSDHELSIIAVFDWEDSNGNKVSLTIYFSDQAIINVASNSSGSTHYTFRLSNYDYQGVDISTLQVRAKAVTNCGVVSASRIFTSADDTLA